MIRHATATAAFMTRSAPIVAVVGLRSGNMRYEGEDEDGEEDEGRHGVETLRL
jgi:hypothetical protein